MLQNGGHWQISKNQCLTLNLVTIASFRIRVPTILAKTSVQRLEKSFCQAKFSFFYWGAVSNFAGLKMGTKFRLKREWQRTSRLKLNAFCRYIIYIPIRTGLAADYFHHIELSPPNLKNDPPGLVWDGSLYLLCSIVLLSIQSILLYRQAVSKTWKKESLLDLFIE